MSTLSYSSERAFMDYSKALSNELGNIKLTTLRLAMAKVDDFHNLEKYRSALASQNDTADTSPQPYTTIERNGSLITLTTDAYLPYGFGLTMTEHAIDHLNDLINTILIGDQGMGLQELDAERIEKSETLQGQDRYAISGHLDLNELDLNDALASLLTFFKDNGDASKVLLRTTEGNRNVTFEEFILQHADLAEAWADQNSQFKETALDMEFIDPGPWCDVSVRHFVKDNYGVESMPDDVAIVLIRLMNN